MRCVRQPLRCSTGCGDHTRTCPRTVSSHAGASNGIQPAVRGRLAVEPASAAERSEERRRHGAACGARDTGRHALPARVAVGCAVCLATPAHGAACGRGAVGCGRTPRRAAGCTSCWRHRCCASGGACCTRVDVCVEEASPRGSCASHTPSPGVRCAANMTQLCSCARRGSRCLSRTRKE